jgi:DNA-binding transcriptional regulator PaaX
LKSEICHLQSSEAWRAADEREAWLAAVQSDPLLPERLLPADYLGRPAWERRKAVLRRTGERLRTFAP